MTRWNFIYLILFLQIAFIPPALSGPFSGNTLDDTFTVKKVEGKQAVLQGKAQGLKAGDPLYFARSPFKFTVTEVKGDTVTIAVPDKSDLAAGNTLVRNQTEAMKKAMDTELKLKSALEE